MAVKHEGVHVVPVRKAKSFLIEGQDGLTFIGADFPHKAVEIRRVISLAAAADVSEA